MAYAIKIDNVTKTYQLGERTGARLLTEALSRRKKPESSSSSFNALEQVSFEIQEGSAVGIIGRNGAGKTTLLKLISRITRPTSGEIRIRGRVGSLLEVGTGFHPELTGRENIFMNGSMLGMKRVEITRKFDEIVAFADVEQFIDTPVKRYSSGMYVRLAFAVAAHLEPEILVVDEVLAVGDAAFQRKCLGKMEQVAGTGRTVLFVSHNLSAVQQLTSRAVLLDRGRLIGEGPTAEMLEAYVDRSEGRSPTDLTGVRRWSESMSRAVELLEAAPIATASIFAASDPLRFRVKVRSNEEIRHHRLFVCVYQLSDAPVGATWSDPLDAPSRGHEAEYELNLEGLSLAPGRYHLALGTGRDYGQRLHTDFDGVRSVCDFEVAAPEGEGGTLTFWAPVWGPVRFSTLKVQERGLTEGSGGR